LSPLTSLKYIFTTPIILGVASPTHPTAATFTLPNFTQIFQQYDPYKNRIF